MNINILAKQFSKKYECTYIVPTLWKKFPSLPSSSFHVLLNYKYFKGTIEISKLHPSFDLFVTRGNVYAPI